MNFVSFYNENYKKFTWVVIFAFVLSLIYLSVFYFEQGDLMRKDVSLTGGTAISVFDSELDIEDLRAELSFEFEDLVVREISDFSTGETQGVLVESQSSSQDLRSSLERYLGYELDSENSSIEFTGASLSQGFYHQLRFAIVAAFLLMGWVVFFLFGDSIRIKGYSLILTCVGLVIAMSSIGLIMFVGVVGVLVGGVMASSKVRNSKEYLYPLAAVVVAFVLMFLFPIKLLLLFIGGVLVFIYGRFSVPSIAVISAAFFDIVMTLAFVNLTGMVLSSAGIIAFLMLIGYSVDTDILLTTRVLRQRDSSVNSRVYSAFKTGVTMTLTSIVAMAVALIIIYSTSDVLRQIFTILLVGLIFDLINTWLFNASIIKWYVGRKEK